MFIAMNRFRVKKGSEDAFEKVWLGRESYLDRVPGFLEFHLLRGPEAEDHTLYSSHTVWQSGLSRRGPNRNNSESRMRVPVTRQLDRSIWSIQNLKASKYARPSLETGQRVAFAPPDPFGRLDRFNFDFWHDAHHSRAKGSRERPLA